MKIMCIFSIYQHILTNFLKVFFFIQIFITITYLNVVY